LLAGCASSIHSPPLFHQFEATEHYKRHRPTGIPLTTYGEPAQRPITLKQIIARAAKSDVILFGEEHNDVVCNQLEAEVLGGLISRGIKPALSMEFLERDVQPIVDQYLAGQIDEATFIRSARLGKNYAVSHRPLIELAKAHKLPVIAANAPRGSVREYRQSELQYTEYRKTLPPEKAALLPETVFRNESDYRARFFEIMGLPAPGSPAPHPTSAPASAPSGAHGPITAESVERMYQAQLVWDSAMAESIANHRKQHPNRKVLHIVGAFHVEHEGGTLAAYRARMPKDRALAIVYHGHEIGEEASISDDKTPGDIVILGVRPKRDEE
jgi:uncharacterized iron-regulated protein